MQGAYCLPMDKVYHVIPRNRSAIEKGSAQKFALKIFTFQAYIIGTYHNILVRKNPTFYSGVLQQATSDLICEHPIGQVLALELLI